MTKTLKQLSFSLLIVVLLGCNTTEEPPQTNIFPEAGTISGWTPVAETRTFDSKNLFDLVNGQAESFFVLGFEQVQVQDYENAEGIRLGVEVWQLASPADAYGVYSTAIVGDPVVIGNDGDSNPGRRLAFWQDRYFVHIRARQAVDDADLQAFAQAVSTALPAGGEKPELVSQMPTENLVDRTPIYFHQDLTLQNYLWLGTDNPLNLSQAANAVLGHYEIDGEMAQLLLVQYPDVEAAATALAALRGDGIEDLVLADSRDVLLGAVFGEVSLETAQTLLASVL